MSLVHGLPLAFLALPLLAQGGGTRSAWALATEAKGAVVTDLGAKEWRVTVGGREVTLKQVEAPDQTGTLPQNWAVVFEPIRDPAYRIGAFQAAAQFLVNLPDGDRVLIVARTRAGLTALTPGLTTDRMAWVKALEALPEQLSMTFDGTPGAKGPGLDAPALPPSAPARMEPFVAGLRAFLGGLAKAVAASPNGKPEARGVRPIDRLGFDSPTSVRGSLSVVKAEMTSLASLLTALGKVPGPSHALVFSRNDADDFVHPTVRGAMNGTFTRKPGDDGGPRESAELAQREMTLSQALVRNAALDAQVTLHAVAGSGPAHLGCLGTTAEATGGLALPFDGQMPAQLGAALQAFGSRYRLTWTEGAESPSGRQPLSITTTRGGVTLAAPRER